MSRIGNVFKVFGRAIMILSHGKPAVPLGIYFALKLCIILLYARSWSGAVAGFWKLLRPGAAGEALSHYPDRLLLMPIVLGRLDIPLSILFLALAQGATVLLVAGAARSGRLELRSSAAGAARRYVHLAAAAAIVSAAIFVAFRYPVALIDSIVGMPRGLEAALSVLLGIVVQTFFMYSVPLIVLDGRGVLSAVKRSAAFAGRHFIESFCLALVPFLFTVPTLLLTINPHAVAFQISPEFLVQAQIAGEFMEYVTGYVLVGGLTLYLLDTRAKEGI